MAGGSLRLHEYPADVVRLSCPKCGRVGQYRKEILIERFGADIRLPFCERKLQTAAAAVSGATATWFVTLIWEAPVTAMCEVVHTRLG